MASFDNNNNAHKPIISSVCEAYDCCGIPFLEEVIPLRDGRTASLSFDEVEDVNIEAHKIKKAQEEASENMQAIPNPPTK